MLTIPERTWKFFGTRADAEQYCEQMQKYGLKSKVVMRRYNLYAVITNEQEY